MGNEALAAPWKSRINQSELVVHAGQDPGPLEARDFARQERHLKNDDPSFSERLYLRGTTRLRHAAFSKLT